MSFARLLDADLEKDLKNECVLTGVSGLPLLPIQDTLSPSLTGLSQEEYDACLWTARRKAQNVMKTGNEALTENEIAAINIYTQETPIYSRINQMLRARDRIQLKPWFPYLKLLLTAVHKLPAVLDTLYRGVKLDIAGLYPKDAEIVWWSFSSSTATLDVLQSDQFLGNMGKRTLFNVRARRAVDIQRYSAIGAEDERIILPGTVFVVKSVLDCGSGLKIIQLEDAGHPSLIPGFSFTSKMSNLDEIKDTMTSMSIQSTTLPDVCSTSISSLPAKLKAMQTHLNSASLQENACGALWNMAGDAANKVPLVQAGARILAQLAVKNHGSTNAEGLLSSLPN